MRSGPVVYEKTQFGLATVLTIGAIMAVIYFTAIVTDEPRPMFLTIEGVLVVIALAFSTMTIRVTSTALEWWFAFGLLHQRKALAEIVQVGTIATPVLAGFGYRVSDTGAIWRVNGSTAVLFDLVDGKRLALGSDEPERAVAAVKPLLTARPAATSG